LVSCLNTTSTNTLQSVVGRSQLNASINYDSRVIVLEQRSTFYIEQEAQLSQRGRAMPRVVEYFG